MAQMRPSSNVLTRELGEEIVLMDLGSEKYFSLNETGTVVWSLMADGADLDFIAQQLSVRFDIDELKAMADVVSLLEHFQSAGLISTSD